MDIKAMIEAMPFLLEGSIMTVQLTFLTIILGTILGIVTALFKLTNSSVLRAVSTLYTWIFRGTPMILQLFFFYYALPMMGVKLTSFTAAVIGLSLNCGAYMGEIIRGG